MASSTPSTFAFTLNWKLSVASAVFLPLLVGLGFWQLDRAQEKQTILDEWYTQQAFPPKAIHNLEDANALAARPVNIHGQFDAARYWLLESRFYKGALGYEVLMALHTTNGESVLVNRGWVKASAYRENLPEIRTPEGELELQGSFKIPSDFGLLQDVESDDLSWPIRVLEINTESMSKQMGVDFYPRVLRLDANTVGALAVDWQVINVKPAKHKAYAFQWFAMSVALCVLWLTANTNILQFFKSTPRDNNG